MVGGVSNYFLNRVWTFGSRRNALVEGLQFLAVSAIALLVGNVVFTIAAAYEFPPLYDDLVCGNALWSLRQFFPQQVLDLSSPQLRALRTRLLGVRAGRAVVLIALVLRLHGIHDPILDHPGWRQGDTAAIARNFARLRFDIMYPQTLYNGPPPNYVELELQIVPFLAAVALQASWSARDLWPDHHAGFQSRDGGRARPISRVGSSAAR